MARGLLVPGAVLAVLFTVDCGGGGGQSNPPPPDVIIDAVQQFLDVGQRYELDGSRSTDPNGDDEDLEFQWRLVSGGIDSDFDDHCRDDFDEICFTNDDDTCSNDLDRFCTSDDDCLDLGTCDFNSGTTSSDCTTGICGIDEGDEDVMATLVANVAGPYTVRLTAIGSESNGTDTMILDTYPSLYLVGSLYQFGGTEGGLVGEVEDAAEFAASAFQGTSDPSDGNLLLIDDDLEVIRVFDLRSGAVLGGFGQVDTFVDDPAAMVFHPDNGRLYVAEEGGLVRVFDGASGLLLSSFGNVGASPLSMAFSPNNGDLLVVDGEFRAGVRAYRTNGTLRGVLGDTDTAADEIVDLAFLPATDTLLLADRTGKVVACDVDGSDCGVFSSSLDSMLDPGSPSSIAVNPSLDDTTADVLVADPVGERVIACTSNGTGCGTFGDTDGMDSDYADVFFAPTEAPTTTTTTTSTTSTTLN